ncbi:MAG TPA: outer membrane beta-barrel protein [Vicinamibacterales bacterium]|nr:outer membrane beta-barrel protein [Vicinamibacterales bacterium]
MRVSLLLGVWLSCAASSFAQVASDQPGTATPLPPPAPRKPLGQVEFGPLVMTPTVAFMNIGVDNNVYNSAQERQVAFTATVSPQIRLLYKSGRLMIDSNTAADYIYYGVDTTLGGFTPRTVLNVEYRVGRRITLLFNDYVASHKDRPSIEIDARVRHTTTAVGTGVRVGLAPKMDLELGVRQADISYADGTVYDGVKLEQTLNQRTRSAYGSLSYRVTPYTAVRTLVSIDDQTYPLSPDRDGQSNLYAGGLSFSPRALIAGDAMLGVRQFWSHSPTQPDFTGLAADGRLTLTLGDSTGFLVSGHRDLNPSYELTNPYVLQSSYQVAVQQHVTRRFDVGLSYTTIKMDYATFTNAPAFANAGNNVQRGFGASVGVMSTHLARYAVYYEHWERSWATDPGRRFNDDRWGFMITPTRWLTTTNSASRTTLVNSTGL